MAGEETVGKATVELGADGSKLAPEMTAAMAKAQGALERANKQMERAQASAMKAIQAEIDKINAVRPTNEMRMLEQAVSKLGGTSALTKDQLGRVTLQVNALAAAGAKVPASLSGLTGMGSKLEAAFQSLGTGGGVSGALAAIGPAGVMAAGALGAVTIAGAAAFREISNLAAEGEHWSNLAMQTGLGAVPVQQLSGFLADAGVPAEALGTAMKELQKEIAGGGKEVAKFGVDISSLKDLSPEEQLRGMAAQIMAIEDPAIRTAAAVAAFGRSGAELIPVLEGIAAGADKALSAFSKEQLAALKEADDTIDGFTRKLTFLRKTLEAGFIDLAQRGFGEGFSPTALLGPKINLVTESLADFEKRMAEIRKGGEVGGGLILGGEPTPEQKAAVAAYEASQKKAEEAAKRLIEAHKALVAQLSGSAAQEELGKLTAAFNELGLEGVADIEALRKKLEQLQEQGAKITDKGLLGILRGGKVQIPKPLENLDLGLGLPEMPVGTLAVAQEKFSAIAIAAAQAGLSTKEIDDALKSAGASGGQLEVALAAVPVSFGAAFKQALATLPQVIVGTLQGGGEVGKAVGAQLGGGLGDGLKKKLEGTLTSILGKTFGGALSAMIPGLGSLLGGLFGGLFSKLFGNKEIMHVNDLRDAFLSAHGGWLELQQTLAKTTDEDLVKKIFDAKTVEEFNAAVAEVEAMLAKLGDNVQPVTIPVDYEVTGGPPVEATGAPWPETAGDLPEFARGGIVSRPTVAKIGEVPEAIIPLNRLGAGIEALARGGRAGTGARGGSRTTINLSIAEDPFQTTEGRVQLRRHTLKTVERQTAKKLAALIAAGRA